MAVEERFTITEQGYTVGKLLDSTECQILLDTGASKSFICLQCACTVSRSWNRTQQKLLDKI